MSDTITYPPGISEKLQEFPELKHLVITDLSDIQKTSKVGEGSYGEVYRGMLKVAAMRERNGTLPPGDRPRDEIVAIKTLSPILSGSANETRFWREIRTQAMCKHPCVLPLLGFSLVDTHPIVVTKFVSGGSLEDVLAKKLSPLVRWTNTDLACCLYGVANALREVHKHNVIHRDVKPANVLLAKKQPLLCDFGLARDSDDQLAKSKLAGSMLFMAPDVIVSDHYTNKVDVYSFAVTAYVMIAGVQDLPLENGKLTPAFGDRVRDKGRQIRPNEFQKFILEGGRFVKTEGFDDKWWDLITMCWHKEPEQRPSFEKICDLITAEPEKFALAKDPKNAKPSDAKLKERKIREREQQFKDYVEDLNSKILTK